MRVFDIIHDSDGNITAPDGVYQLKYVSHSDDTQYEYITKILNVFIVNNTMHMLGYDKGLNVSLFRKMSPHEVMQFGKYEIHRAVIKRIDEVESHDDSILS